MKERRGRHKDIYIIYRIADLVVYGFADRFQIRRNAFKRPKPIADTENIHAYFKDFGPESQSSQCHITAVACAHDADTLVVDITQTGEIGFGLHAIPQRFPSMPAICRRKKSFAIAGTATVIDSQHRISVVYEILNLSVITTHGLATRPAMN